MITFESNRKNSFFTVFKNWAIALIPIAIFCLIQYHFHLINANPTLIPIASIFALLFIFYDGLTETRINCINIDVENKIVSLQFYNLYNGQNQKKFQFAELQIKIQKPKRKWWNSEIIINILTNKSGNFSITKHKDGFALKTLEQLSSTLEKLTTPTN